MGRDSGQDEKKGHEPGIDEGHKGVKEDIPAKPYKEAAEFAAAEHKRRMKGEKEKNHSPAQIVDIMPSHSELPPPD